ncbi:subtilisin-like protein [Lactarius quietus]|nr:subtilisin-like protein [Lactarius quietus]
MGYLWLSVLSVIFAVPFNSFATPLAPFWSDIRVKHTWNTVPENWENLGPPPAGATINLYISLKPHPTPSIRSMSSSPLIPSRLNSLFMLLRLRYGAHLSREQVAELVAPHRDTLELVHSWLEHHGVQPSSISRSHGGGWLTITAVPVSQADKLLSASYQIYKLTGTTETDSETILRTVNYSLPAALHTHVRTVAPTTLFASPHTPLQALRKRSTEEAAVMTNATSDELVKVLSRDDFHMVTPEIVRSLYKTKAYVPTAGGYNAIGILGLTNEYPSPADLKQFMTAYRSEAVAATITVSWLNGGGYDPSRPGKEASVDTQYCSAMSYPTPQYFYSTGGLLKWSNVDGLPAEDDPYLAWLKYLLGLTHIPPTISISYANPEQQFPPEYAITICELFAQLGARGVSVLVASGNIGVGYGDCRDSSGNVQFIPMFPATCPYVTSVGGTRGYPEAAMSFSGGGFSRVFPREDYQAGAVFKYLQNLGNQYAGLYNYYGRGVPDIAAQSHRVAFIVKSVPDIVSGTSCATPIVAGIVALLNDFRISNGRKPLGFLNPWLYGRGLAGLNDITSGNNPGCNTPGFTAITGWDPVRPRETFLFGFT